MLAKNADYEVDERLERLGLDYIDLLLLHHTAAYDEQAYQTLSQHEVIKDIAQAHQKSTYQVILRWHLQSGIIAIPGSSRSTFGRLLPTGRKNATHIAEDYDIFDFELTTDEMKRINDLECGHRFASY